MTHSRAALSAAEEILKNVKIILLNVEDDTDFIVEIIERHTAPKAVTTEDVTAFIQGKIADLRAVCPDYISFACDAIQLNAESPVVSKFRVYSKNTASFEGGDPDQLIRQATAALAERGEALQLRQQAADLIARANQLDMEMARSAITGEPEGGAE